MVSENLVCKQNKSLASGKLCLGGGGWEEYLQCALRDEQWGWKGRWVPTGKGLKNQVKKKGSSSRGSREGIDQHEHLMALCLFCLPSRPQTLRVLSVLFIAAS